MAEYKKIKIQDLAVDLENYRVGKQENELSAMHAIIDEQGNEKIYNLAQDIIKMGGLSPIEFFW